MNTTIDFNVLSVFMSFESVTYLHYFVGSDRAVCIIFSLIPRPYYSEFTSVFVTDSQYHECICHRLTVPRVYVSTAVRINPKSGFEFSARSVQSFVAHLFPKYILSRHFIK